MQQRSVRGSAPTRARGVTTQTSSLIRDVGRGVATTPGRGEPLISRGLSVAPRARASQSSGPARIAVNARPASSSAAAPRTTTTTVSKRTPEMAHATQVQQVASEKPAGSTSPAPVAPNYSQPSAAQNWEESEPVRAETAPKPFAEQRPQYGDQSNSTLAHLIGVNLHHREKAISQLQRTVGQQNGEYRIWSSGLYHVDNLDQLKDDIPENQTMQPLDADLRHLEEGILVLVPRSGEVYLPLFDPIPGLKINCLKLVVLSTTSTDPDEATLIEGVIRGPTPSERAQLQDNGLYNVELLYSLSSGVMVYFNANDFSLGRIEFHLGDDSNSLPVWYLRYLYHQGFRREATQLGEYRQEVLDLAANAYPMIPRIGRGAPVEHSMTATARSVSQTNYTALATDSSTFSVFRSGCTIS